MMIIDTSIPLSIRGKLLWCEAPCQVRSNSSMSVRRPRGSGAKAATDKFFSHTALPQHPSVFHLHLWAKHEILQTVHDPLCFDSSFVALYSEFQRSENAGLEPSVPEIADAAQTFKVTYSISPPLQLV
jgi:hypothetical protein